MGSTSDVAAKRCNGVKNQNQCEQYVGDCVRQKRLQKGKSKKEKVFVLDPPGPDARAYRTYSECVNDADNVAASFPPDPDWCADAGDADSCDELVGSCVEQRKAGKKKFFLDAGEGLTISAQSFGSCVKWAGRLTRRAPQVKKKAKQVVEKKDETGVQEKGQKKVEEKQVEIGTLPKPVANWSKVHSSRYDSVPDQEDVDYIMSSSYNEKKKSGEIVVVIGGKPKTFTSNQAAQKLVKHYARRERLVKKNFSSRIDSLLQELMRIGTKVKKKPTSMEKDSVYYERTRTSDNETIEEVRILATGPRAVLIMKEMAELKAKRNALIGRLRQECLKKIMALKLKKATVGQKSDTAFDEMEEEEKKAPSQELAPQGKEKKAQKGEGVQAEPKAEQEPVVQVINRSMQHIPQTTTLLIANALVEAGFEGKAELVEHVQDQDKKNVDRYFSIVLTAKDGSQGVLLLPVITHKRGSIFSATDLEGAVGQVIGTWKATMGPASCAKGKVQNATYMHIASDVMVAAKIQCHRMGYAGAVTIETLIRIEDEKRFSTIRIVVEVEKGQQKVFSLKQREGSIDAKGWREIIEEIGALKKSDAKTLKKK